MHYLSISASAKREDQTELTVAPCKGTASLTSGGTHSVPLREALLFINIMVPYTHQETTKQKALRSLITPTVLLVYPYLGINPLPECYIANFEVNH